MKVKIIAPKTEASHAPPAPRQQGLMNCPVLGVFIGDALWPVLAPHLVGVHLLLHDNGQVQTTSGLQTTQHLPTHSAFGAHEWTASFHLLTTVFAHRTNHTLQALMGLSDVLTSK